MSQRPNVKDFKVVSLGRRQCQLRSDHRCRKSVREISDKVSEDHLMLHLELGI